MKSVISFLLILSQAINAAAFAVQPQAPAVNLDTLSSVAQTKVVNAQLVQQQIMPSSFNSYLESSSTLVSLKDRPPPPTPEEIAAKKANFNLWFWGGGFVAPFLATIYYFGFQFWKR